jgi:hypothetical protein
LAALNGYESSVTGSGPVTEGILTPGFLFKAFLSISFAPLYSGVIFQTYPTSLGNKGQHSQMTSDAIGAAPWPVFDTC